jgi:hypothetical protein
MTRHCDIAVGVGHALTTWRTAYSAEVGMGHFLEYISAAQRPNRDPP